MNDGNIIDGSLSQYDQRLAKCCNPPKNECACGPIYSPKKAICGKLLNCSMQGSPSGGVMCDY